MPDDGLTPEACGMKALQDIRRMLSERPVTDAATVAEPSKQTRAGKKAKKADIWNQLVEQQRVTHVLANLTEAQDDRINFRINGAIKAEFERLCRAGDSTLSKELKRFMVEAIKRQSLN